MTVLLRLTSQGERWQQLGREVLGGKAIGIQRLQAVGLPVPETWVIPAGEAAQEHELRGLVRFASRWAVRSSAALEDDARHSFAGIFTTELDVPATDLGAAIARVRSSAGSRRALSYRARRGVDTGPVRMAVLLQPYVTPRYSGVWIGRSAVSGRLEWVSGCGESLVSGLVKPAWEEWTRGGWTTSEAEILRESGGRPVGDACLGAQRVLNCTADLELALVGHEVTWLQFRPVTSPLAPAGAANAAAGQDLVVGVAAAPGRAEGVGCRVSDPDDVAWRPGMILLAEVTDPDWVPLMAEAAALVTAEGGMLCHAAIVARELGLPCVTGVGSERLAALEGVLLEVDGTAGIVRRPTDPDR